LTPTVCGLGQPRDGRLFHSGCSGTLTTLCIPRTAALRHVHVMLGVIPDGCKHMASFALFTHAATLDIRWMFSVTHCKAVSYIVCFLFLWFQMRQNSCMYQARHTIYTRMYVPYASFICLLCVGGCTLQMQRRLSEECVNACVGQIACLHYLAHAEVCNRSGAHSQGHCKRYSYGLVMKFYCLWL
jgi:hypothetical protein